jgi:hypothetical protein
MNIHWTTTKIKNRQKMLKFHKLKISKMHNIMKISKVNLLNNSPKNCLKISRQHNPKIEMSQMNN